MTEFRPSKWFVAVFGATFFFGAVLALWHGSTGLVAALVAGVAPWRDFGVPFTLACSVGGFAVAVFMLRRVGYCVELEDDTLRWDGVLTKVSMPVAECRRVAPGWFRSDFAEIERRGGQRRRYWVSVQPTEPPHRWMPCWPNLLTAPWS